MVQVEDMANIKQKMDQVTGEILRTTRSQLLLALPFLGSAIGRLSFVTDDMVFTLATEGQRLYVSSHWAIETYRKEPKAVSRAILHSVLHCIFQHPFVSSNKNKKAWDVATDIAVEATISHMGLEAVDCSGVQHQTFVLQMLKDRVKPLTAEVIYRYLLEKQYGEEELERMGEHFCRDNHSLWWPEEEDEANDQAPDGSQSEAQSQAADALRQEWEEITKMLDVDLETLSKDKQNNDILTQNLKSLTRDRYDYGEFLRKFAIRGEDMRINDDEFDYVFYTYGLRHYGNLPLVEPLEYKEIQKISDFVIAIDTSGSVQGPLVQKFLDKTYSILHMEESFFKKINLRIVLCDDQIQDVATIYCQEDFERYFKGLQLKGFGGTDFRPVFSLVEDWVRQKEFANLKGLIYLTDGYGRYPDKSPSFDAAFVYVGYDPDRPPTPSWAMKLVLEEEQLMEERK